MATGKTKMKKLNYRQTNQKRHAGKVCEVNNIKKSARLYNERGRHIVRVFLFLFILISIP